MAKAGFELFYAVRFRSILHYLGQFFLVAAGLNTVTVVVGLLHAEVRFTLYYVIVVMVLAALGLLLSRIPVREHLQFNEAMVIAALIFLCVPLIATLPLCLAGHEFSDALFETVSAVTTTGLSTLGGIEGRAQIFVFARAWMQWYGGLGIVILSLAFVMQPGLSALRLSRLERGDDDLAGGTRAYAKRILLVYLALTVVGLLLWMVGGGNPYDGILYILAAVSTGGFAPTSGSLADLDNLFLAWIVTLSCLAGALPLILYYVDGKRDWKSFFRNTELRALLLAGIAMMFLVGYSMWQQGLERDDILVHAPLMALSAQTTSGFSSIDPGSLAPAAKGVLILAMATGGSIGSTAGGFKLLRLLILLSVLIRSVVRLGMPANAVSSQKIGNRVIGEFEVQDALMIILAFIGVVFLSWLPFLYQGYAPLDALFDVVSATATVGLSSGVTGAALPDALKYILCVDMLFGRLEFVAWIVLLYPRTWFGRKRGS